MDGWDGGDFVKYGGGWGRSATPDNYHASRSGQPRRARNHDTKLVDQIRDGLNRLDIDTATIATQLSLLPTGIQQNLMDIIMTYLRMLADRDGRYPGHQMETTYAVAKKMIDSLSK